MSITVTDRQAIREAFGFCCGYCGVSESDIGGQLKIDHNRPVTKGGNDTLDNLVYACVHCNRFKGNYWPDENNPQSYYLLHPVEDDPALHFKLTASGRLEGSTPRGWYHIRRLHLNRPQLVVWRQNWQRYRELEEALQHSQAITHQLQQRIRELEQEALRLRQQIARLSGSGSNGRFVKKCPGIRPFDAIMTSRQSRKVKAIFEEMMQTQMTAVELTGTIDEHNQLHLDDKLPITGPKRVRIIVLTAVEEEISEEEWLKAASKNPAFQFLHDAAEDIYTLDDGKPIEVEK